MGSCSRIQSNVKMKTHLRFDCRRDAKDGNEVRACSIAEKRLMFVQIINFEIQTIKWNERNLYFKHLIAQSWGNFDQTFDFTEGKV